MKFNYTVFSTNKNYYLFDGVSCNIFSIEEDIYNNHEEIFKKIYNNTYENDGKFSSSYNSILSAIKSNFLMSTFNNEFEYWFDVNQYKKQCSAEMNHLMIGLTENCNMRCKYCVYGGHYKNERMHSNNDMNIDILKQSINYFFKSSKNPNKIVNFYGGEPFLKFKEIGKTVEYINNIDPSVTYYITTNGVLLNDEILAWFSKNKNVNLFISLAGITERHDELRVLANGKKTFSTIKDNILKLKQYDFESYKERINFVFNIFDEVQLEEIQHFWENDEMFKGLTRLPEITFIDCIDDDGVVRQLGDRVISQYPQNANPLKKYISLLREKKYNNLIVKHYDNKFLTIHRRLTNCNDNILSAVCRPFTHKMFVDILGNVHICENFKFGDKLGNVYKEFSLDKIDELLNIYKNERCKTCIDCWASKICSLCFRDIIDKNGIVNIERANKLCSNERSSKLKYLIEYCMVLEKGETLLDHLNEYIIHA